MGGGEWGVGVGWGGIEDEWGWGSVQSATPVLQWRHRPVPRGVGWGWGVGSGMGGGEGGGGGVNSKRSTFPAMAAQTSSSAKARF